MNKPWHSLTWECYLAFRRREQPIHEDTLRNINNMFLRKRLDWKDCILQPWDILDIQTCGGSKMISARPGLERREGCLDRIGTLAKSLQGLSAFSMPHLHWLKEAILNNGVNILDALLYTHSKCNSQKWAIRMHQRWLADSNKCTMSTVWELMRVEKFWGCAKVDWLILISVGCRQCGSLCVWFWGHLRTWHSSSLLLWI